MHTRPTSAKYFLEQNGSPSAWFKERIERKEALQQLFKPRDVSQSKLLSKVNLYLAQQKKNLNKPISRILSWSYLIVAL